MVSRVDLQKDDSAAEKVVGIILYHLTVHKFFHKRASLPTAIAAVIHTSIVFFCLRWLVKINTAWATEG